jgi:hypothetical protein
VPIIAIRIIFLTFYSWICCTSPSATKFAGVNGIVVKLVIKLNGIRAEPSFPRARRNREVVRRPSPRNRDAQNQAAADDRNSNVAEVIAS